MMIMCSHGSAGKLAASPRMAMGLRYMRGISAVAFTGAALTLGMPGFSAAQPVSALSAPAGVTALSGRVVDQNGHGLPRIRVADNATATYTDALGRYLLAPVPVGKSVIQIDGRPSGLPGAPDYGFHEVRGVSAAGVTSDVGFISWLKPVDHGNDMSVASPTIEETVVRTPAIPGLEIHIPAGTMIRDAEGRPVTRIGITALPDGRQALPPPPPGVNMPIAFTVQPGAACLYSPDGGVGYARVIYPNVFHRLPRARITYWRYEPDAKGWRIYGAGTVSNDGSQVIPDRDTVITDFASAECDPQTRSHPLTLATTPTRPGSNP